MVFVFRVKSHNNEKSNTELELFELYAMIHRLHYTLRSNNGCLLTYSMRSARGESVDLLPPLQQSSPHTATLPVGEQLLMECHKLPNLRCEHQNEIHLILGGLIYQCTITYISTTLGIYWVCIGNVLNPAN